MSENENKLSGEDIRSQEICLHENIIREIYGEFCSDCGIELEKEFLKYYYLCNKHGKSRQHYCSHRYGCTRID